jgi:hypothetical protein
VAVGVPGVVAGWLTDCALLAGAAAWHCWQLRIARTSPACYAGVQH